MRKRPTPKTSSRAFATMPLKVEQPVRSSPVIVTNRGRPELVVASYDQWCAPVPQKTPEDLIDALGTEYGPEIDLVVPRAEIEPRPVDLDDR